MPGVSSVVNRLALVLGGASCVWRDVARLRELCGGEWPGLVLAVNDIGCEFPVVHHWVSLHPEKFEGWEARRRAAGLPGGYVKWGGIWRTGRYCSDLVDRLLPCAAMGSSGFHAVMVALHLKRDRIVLAGVPMDASPHFFDPQVPWDSALAHRDAWSDWLMLLRGRVTSMSGWTAELLGPPSRSWLELG